MAGKKPTMRENISSRPTDSSGRRATDADLGIGPGVAALRKAAAEKIMKREGTTSPSGARPAVLRVAPAKPVKPVAKIIPAKQQAIIRTTTAYKPTPTKKK
jgi:hypothetical protein